MDKTPRHKAAADAALKAAEEASDEKVSEMLRMYADDIEHDGRAHAPQWMRVAAARLLSMSASQ